MPRRKERRTDKMLAVTWLSFALTVAESLARPSMLTLSRKQKVEKYMERREHYMSLMQASNFQMDEQGLTIMDFPKLVYGVLCWWF